MLQSSSSKVSADLSLKFSGKVVGAGAGAGFNKEIEEEHLND
jgi:hypothetical protein